jgi:hypothetical protein
MLGSKTRTSAEVRNLSLERAWPMLMLQHAFFHWQSRSTHLNV